MTLRTLIITLFIFCCSIALHAQQMSVVSLFDQNLTYLNPAATGNQEVLTASFFYRNHWTGFDGAPSTQFFSVHAPLKNPKVALGVMLEHESIGSTNYTGAYFNYAYRLNAGPGKLSLGLKLGMNSGSQDYLNLREENEFDDPAFNDKNRTFFVPNAGFGVLYYTEMYWAGFSIPRFFGFQSDPSGTYKISHEIANYEYHFAGGGKIALPSEFSMEPSVLLVYSAVYPFRVALNATGIYKNTYRAGIGYRYGEAFILLIGYHLNRQFSFGYSYDINMGEISDYTSGSHEIYLQYKFGYKVNASNPRGF